jgi:hypothetical protein
LLDSGDTFCLGRFEGALADFPTCA